MNPTLQEQRDIIQAKIDGKKVQLRLKKIGDHRWTDCNPTAFNFGDYEYRVKPEPREIFVNEYPGDAGPVLSSYHHNSHYRALTAGSTDATRVVKFREVLDE